MGIEAGGEVQGYNSRVLLGGVNMRIKSDIRNGAVSGLALGLFVGALEAARWLFTPTRSAGATLPPWLHTLSIVFAVVVLTVAGAAVALLNRLADWGSLGSTLTGLIVGLAIGCGYSLIAIASGMAWTAPILKLILLGSVGLGLVAGVALALFRYFRGTQE